jgi:hypothetical protein
MEWKMEDETWNVYVICNMIFSRVSAIVDSYGRFYSKLTFHNFHLCHPCAEVIVSARRKCGLRGWVRGQGGSRGGGRMSRRDAGERSAET